MWQKKKKKEKGKRVRLLIRSGSPVANPNLGLTIFFAVSSRTGDETWSYLHEKVRYHKQDVVSMPGDHLSPESNYN